MIHKTPKLRLNDLLEEIEAANNIVFIGIPMSCDIYR